MRRINTELIEKKLYETALLAGVQLTPSCKAAMGNALKTEKSEEIGRASCRERV